MLRTFAIILVALTIGFNPSYTEAASKNYCTTWAKELRKAGFTTGSADYELHRRGCQRPYSTWQPSSVNRCTRLAYRKAKLGYRGYHLNVQVGRYGHCVLYEDGSWGPE